MQVLIVSLASIFVATTLGNLHPYRDLRQNYNGIMKEGVILSILDLLLLSSNPTITTESRYMVGIAMIVILGLLILISMGSQMLESCKVTKLRVQKCCNKRKFKKGHKRSVKKKLIAIVPGDKTNDMSFGQEDNIEVLEVRDEMPQVSKEGNKSRIILKKALQRRIMLDKLEIVSEKSDEEDVSVQSKR